MKRIYEEYLRVPEDRKIKEKVFIMRIVVAIACVVCCLSAMGFSAYAFFTSSITSGSNTIVAATYGVGVAITSSEGTTLTAEADNLLLYEDVAAGTYTVSIKATGTASTGYCKIKIVGSEKTVTLFTQQLPPEVTMSFTLVTNGEADITITPQWGTSSNRDAVVGDKSTQEVKLVTVELNVTTPNTPSVPQVPNTSQQIPDTSQPENQKDKAENDMDDSDVSQGGQVNEQTPSDDVTDGENNDGGSSSDTSSDGNVIE